MFFLKKRTAYFCQKLDKNEGPWERPEKVISFIQISQ